ncbi:hypothetical protein [Tumebacillus flagellatus]|uniref:Uncharacterized protein n=1 Tax=Tumebacillus flagellatus TaxID=1157490 RepID=A0A074MEI6_9BACL|nr:hypothetical protein [Tumebacillus flagellatus]KEO84207.1 hypothetical protein EL26_05425 [Tumebacillus flagellatus]
MAKLRLKETPGTNLLISFLIRYPVLASLRYNQGSQTLSFTVLLKDQVDAERQTEFVEFLQGYYEACKVVDPKFPQLGRVEHAALNGVTVLGYEQRVEILTLVEVRLLMQLFVEFYGDLIGAEALPLQEEELYAQEEIIEQILGQKETWRSEKSIVAYREGGRVFVYNK